MDLAHQNGRLSEQLVQKQGAIRQLQAEKDVLSRENQRARAEIDELKAQLSKAETDKMIFAEDLDRSLKKINEQAATVKQLEERISKANVTIKVQSDQIQQRSSATKSSTTPHRGSSNQGATANVYALPPPAFNPRHDNFLPGQLSGPPPPSTPMSRQSSSQQQPMTPMTRQSSNQFPSSTPMTRQVSGQTPSSAPMTLQQSTSTQMTLALRSRQSQGTSMRQDRSQHASGTGQLVHMQGLQSSIEFGAEFTKIFRLTETWARKYANVPNRDRDNTMHPALKEKFAQSTNPDIVSRLLSSDSTRYLAVAKVINAQINKLAFRPMISKGFSDYYDNQISSIRGQLYNLQSIEQRRALMVAAADVSREMVQSPEWKLFLDDLTRSETSKTWNSLQALLAPNISRQEAWNNLTEIWQESMRLGVSMLQQTSQFNLDYPIVGKNTHFNPAQMVNRDVTFKQEPQSLAQMGATVRLSITPVVTETNLMASAIMPKVLHYANVLLKI